MHMNVCLKEPWPSVSAAEPIDIGLPIPPVLTEVAAGFLEPQTADKAETSSERAGDAVAVLEDLEKPTEKSSSSKELRAFVDLYVDQKEVEVVGT